MRALIVIPARYGSSRFPGKPLKLIQGRSMIERTSANAKTACTQIENADYVVATDDARIEFHCQDKNIPVVLTSSDLKTGTDRAWAALTAYESRHDHKIDVVINLQGDSPFTPPEHLLAIYETLKKGGDVATPYIQLSWDNLDRLREDKRTTPFSGTTVVTDKDEKAIWFSKNIIPAMRHETVLCTETKLSPVKRHIGLYGYTKAALKAFTELDESSYEKLEGLEQLRLLENGFHIQAVEVQPAKISISGIDTQEDLDRAEALLAKHEST